jgi:hypothetical protein
MMEYSTEQLLEMIFSLQEQITKIELRIKKLEHPNRWFVSKEEERQEEERRRQIAERQRAEREAWEAEQRELRKQGNPRIAKPLF